MNRGARVLRLFLALLFTLPLAMTPPTHAETPTPSPATATATFGMGCFWCSEALYVRFKGVQKAVCGYAGGMTKNPTYEEVSTGTTGHAEVVQVTYDPQQITYQQLLDIFWEVHDPTTLNRQGADEGTQYRSAIFTENAEQARLAEASQAAEAAKIKMPVTTEIAPLAVFYPAEDYHQHYFQKHPHAPYCAYVISPKIAKLETHHIDLKKAD